MNLEPVTIEISLDGNIVETISFIEKSNIINKDVMIDLGDSEKEKILSFTISRTWSPKKYGLNDARILGVAVSEIKPVTI